MKTVAFLGALCLIGATTAQAGLSSVLAGWQGKSSLGWSDYSAACESLSKSCNGYSWSMGGGTTTFSITCSGETVSVICQGTPYTSCSSESADGDVMAGDGCTCESAHPTCNSNGWCYQGAVWSETHCTGSCTSSYSNPTLPGNDASSDVCACPADYPYCYAQNQWCYQSATSNDYGDTCGGTCTDHHDGAQEPVTSGGDGDQVANVAACAGSADSMTAAEAQEILDLHNKFRCAVGTPPLTWNAALACQAQQMQDQINAFSHGDSYSEDIPAGENLATGTNVATAAWMWFTEYVQPSGVTGHYTAMVWQATTELGCGIGRNGQGVIRCHYARTPPNYGGQYAANVPEFVGEQAKFDRCNIDIAEVASKVRQFEGWGILSRESPAADSLQGLYEVEPMKLSARMSRGGLLTATTAAVALAAAGVAMGLRRWSHRGDQDMNDQELAGLTGLVQ